MQRAKQSRIPPLILNPTCFQHKVITLLVHNTIQTARGKRTICISSLEMIPQFHYVHSPMGNLCSSHDSVGSMLHHLWRFRWKLPSENPRRFNSAFSGSPLVSGLCWNRTEREERARPKGWQSATTAIQETCMYTRTKSWKEQHVTTCKAMKIKQGNSQTYNCRSNLYQHSTILYTKVI